ncbi:radical SAM/SPASM domain-containing protein [Afifella pfennigii]|uniref:radical SAM/SPASM domain-containing protein n=1 Tax=Afifella pfennigii TaxID=209897 RepID=UPI00047E3E40|nr:radical SAM protein [Afifella pfennigii]
MHIAENGHFPRLRQDIWLKPMQGYALVHGHHPSSIGMLHPSHAFFLALCDGRLGGAELAYLYGETYGLAPAEAETEAAGLLGLHEALLASGEGATWGTPAGACRTNRFSPRRFLYPGDDRLLASAAFGQWPVPAGINITLTFQCNFACSYCYQDLSQTGDRRWDLGKCRELIEEAADWGVVFLGLTGGEPTIFKGWLELLEHGLERGMIPVMTSNGSVIGGDRSIAERLAAAGMREMTISLDAGTPALHDAVTGSRGHFPRVLNAIRHLVDAGIRVVVKSVLTPATQHGVDEMIDLLVSLGVAEIGITQMEGGAVGSGANSAPGLSLAERQLVRETVLARRARYAGLCAIHPPKGNGRPWREDEWYPCGGLNMGMSIFPSGEVTVCDKMHGVKDFTYGNVFAAGLKEIWNGEAFAALRARTLDQALVDPDCARCSKLGHCRTACFVDAFNATGSYYAKDPHCGGPFLHDRLCS